MNDNVACDKGFATDNDMLPAASEQMKSRLATAIGLVRAVAAYAAAGAAMVSCLRAAVTTREE